MSDFLTFLNTAEFDILIKGHLGVDDGGLARISAQAMSTFMPVLPTWTPMPVPTCTFTLSNEAIPIVVL